MASLFELRPTDLLSCSWIARIEFNDPLALFNSRTGIILEEIYYRNVIADGGRKWVKLLRPFDLSHRLIKLPFCIEINCKPVMHRRVVRIETDGTPVFFLSFRPAPQFLICDC